MTTRSKQKPHAAQQQMNYSIEEPKQFLLRRPSPRKAYLALANQSSKVLDSPQHLLIILDLNGTLVRKTRSSNFVGRMFVHEFLKYVMSNHTVMVWSSARPHTVSKRCEKLFSECNLPQPQLVWDRSHFNLSPEHYNRNTQLYKELSTVWRHPNVKAAGKGVVFDQTNTILIDDTQEKAAAEPYNLLQIDEFVFEKKEFGELGQVVTYLEQAKYQSNVSAYLKANPFVLQPEAPLLDWTTLNAVDALVTETQTLKVGDIVDEDDGDGGVPLLR